ncbi:MAG: hypothetical protein HOC92_20550 [Gammaproteobacteria bacterium]|jgi:hypothetical protein|nr:hypothetical protein [Gammaproteobacteria bacterium]MBT4452102.1 hypothetical protein [Gammaproteobacteria bacterium]
MNYPKFFNDVETISLIDPLSKILGSLENGFVEFNYIDSVKAAGHSCPTVGGAYLMTSRALKTLYPDSLPVRGQIKVEFAESLEDGTTGVISNVITNITGATDKSGFKGLNGNFARHSLMFFNVDIQASARFTRLDTNQSVDVIYNPTSVPPDPKMQNYMQKVLSGMANEDDVEKFGILWQDRVKRILIDNSDNVITVKEI